MHVGKATAEDSCKEHHPIQWQEIRVTDRDSR